MGVRDRFIDALVRALGLDFEFPLEADEERLSAISERLLVGGRPRSDELPALRARGITHVVSCLSETERAGMAFLRGGPDRIEHLFVALNDSVHQDLSPALAVAFQFADDAWRNAADARLFVHCEVGVSRSASVAIALLMRAEGKTFLEAFSAVRERRPRVLPNIGFASQLQALEYEMFPERRRAAGPSSLARYLCDVCKAPVEVDLLEQALERCGHDAVAALRSIFDGDIPRVVQGARG